MSTPNNTYAYQCGYAKENLETSVLKCGHLMCHKYAACIDNKMCQVCDALSA